METRTVANEIETDIRYAAWAAQNAVYGASDTIQASRIANALTMAAAYPDEQAAAMEAFRQFRASDAMFNQAIEALAANPAYQRALDATIALGWTE